MRFVLFVVESLVYPEEHELVEATLVDQLEDGLSGWHGDN
jgi:hypothetical protein